MKTFKPRRLRCKNCDGKKWFPSAMGDIGCQVCGASGEGPIDLTWLLADWQRLKQLEAKSKDQPEWLSEALNSGDGTYKP